MLTPHLSGAGAVWCQGPPVSSSSLLSPLLTPALVSRGRRQRCSLPLLLSPVLTQAKVTLFPPDGKMTAAAATTSEGVRERPVGFSLSLPRSLSQSFPLILFVSCALPPSLCHSVTILLCASGAQENVFACLASCAAFCAAPHTSTCPV